MRHERIAGGVSQRNADLVAAVALQQRKRLPLGQLKNVGGLNQWHLDLRGDVVIARDEVHAVTLCGRVRDPGHGGQLHHVDLGHLLGQQVGCGHGPHTQHDQVVEVVHDLAGLGLVANLGLDVEHRLGIGRDLETRATQLVNHGHELRAGDLVDLVKVAADVGQLELAILVVRVQACLVELAAHRDQVGQHRIADRRRHDRVGQGIKACIHNAALAEHSHPVEDRAGVFRIEVVRADELAHRARGELFQEGPQAGHDLFVERALVAERCRQAQQHLVIQSRLLDPQEHGHQFRCTVCQAARNGGFLGCDLADDALDASFVIHEPAFGRMAAKHHVGVVHEQRIDAGHVLEQGLVGWNPPQGDLGLGHDVRETPGEFLESSAVARGGQCVRGTSCNLGDPSKTADAVVPGRNLGVTQVEQVKAALTASAARFSLHAQHQIGIPLGVDDDSHVASMDVLRTQQLQQPGLAHTGGAHHQHVAGAGALAQLDGLFFQYPNAVQDGGASQVHTRRKRIGRTTGINGCAHKAAGQIAALIGPIAQGFAKAGQAQLPQRRAYIFLYPLISGIQLALGVHLGPFKAFTQVQMLLGHGQTVGRYPGHLGELQATLVAVHTKGLTTTLGSEAGGNRRSDQAQRVRHHQRPWRSCGHASNTEGCSSAVCLHRWAQQPFHHSIAHCSSAGTETGRFWRSHVPSRPIALQVLVIIALLLQKFGTAPGRHAHRYAPAPGRHLRLQRASAQPAKG